MGDASVEAIISSAVRSRTDNDRPISQAQITWKNLVWTVEIEGIGGIENTVFLMVVASVGVTLNALVAASLLTMPEVGHRRVAASFVVHACLLDSVKCVYCVPFALSSLQRVDPSVCDALSRYV